MPAKKPISLSVFGILSIVWGLFILSTFALHLLSKPWIPLEHELDEVVSWSYLSSLIFSFLSKPWIILDFSYCELYVLIIWFYLGSLIFSIPLVGGFIVSGIGVLNGKPWSRYLLLITTGFGLWGLVNRLILLGPCTEEFFYISRFFIGGLFIWFFNRKSVRMIFPSRRGLKVITIVWIVVISLEFLGAGIYWFKNFGPYLLKFEPEQAVYQAKDDNFYSRDYFRSPFPLKYSLAIPNGFTIFYMMRDDWLGIMIDLMGSKDNPIKGMITLKDQTSLQKDYSRMKLLGYRNSYRFYQKVYSEKFGLYFVDFRILGTLGAVGMYRLEEVEVDGLRGFLQKGTVIKKGRHINSWGSVYHLFQGHEAIGEGYISIWGTDHQQVDDIVSSIKPKDKPQKTAGDFFQEGKKLFHRKEFEKAKFPFVSALCLDWENPHYHYYLGRAFFETENWFSAKHHLEKAMSFQPDYPEAQQLLNQVKSKETSEKE